MTAAAGAPAPTEPKKPSYAESVFLNCPFDDTYLPFLRAVVFAIHDCGFVVRHALEDAGGAESRLDKIIRLIAQSRLSIHDISRVELSGTGLPRFNMPFECGLALGAVRYGRVKDRDIHVITGVRYQDKASLSDLAGIDPGYHENDQAKAIAVVRGFLAAKAKAATRTHDEIVDRFNEFEANLRDALSGQPARLANLQSLPYIRDWIVLAVKWMKDRPVQQPINLPAPVVPSAP